jgi:hypothetical protein
LQRWSYWLFTATEFFYVVFFLQSNSSIAASFGGVEQAFMPAVELAKFFGFSR